MEIENKSVAHGRNNTTRDDIRQHFERWARWRHGASYSGSGSGGVLGRLTQGRGSNICPTCKGSGRMPGHLVGSTLEFINVPCPQCDGERKVAGDLDPAKRTRVVDCVFCVDGKTGRSTGELPDGRTCHKCQGGKRLVITLKVHPASIPGTRHLGPDTDADPISVLIERLVEGWRHYDGTYWLARVIWQKYCANGTQEMKSMRLGVSIRWYLKNLAEAHRRAAEAIDEFDRNAARAPHG